MMAKLAPHLREMFEGIVAAVNAEDTELVSVGEPKIVLNEESHAVDIYVNTDYKYRAANGVAYNPDYYEHAKTMLAREKEAEKAPPVQKGKGGRQMDPKTIKGLEVAWDQVRQGHSKNKAADIAEYETHASASTVRRHLQEGTLKPKDLDP